MGFHFYLYTVALPKLFSKELKTIYGLVVWPKLTYLCLSALDFERIYYNHIFHMRRSDIFMGMGLIKKQPNKSA
jgi:hypothetical protein